MSHSKTSAVPPLCLWGQEDGLLWGVSGELRWLPRDRSAPLQIVVSGPASIESIAKRYGKPGDRYGATTPGKPSQLIIARKGQPPVILTLSSDSWGYDLQPPEAVEWWRRTCSFLDEQGIELGTTASCIARGLLSRFHAPYAPLPREMQELAHACVNQGPQTLLRGSLTGARESDLRSAYLVGARQWIPSMGGYENWSLLGAENIEYALGNEGFGRFIVEVPENRVIGPLPCRTEYAVMWPVGEFECTVSLNLLRAAIEHGAKVKEIRELWVTRESTKPFGKLCDHIGGLPDPFRKMAYHRLYGVLCSSRWYESEICQKYSGWTLTTREPGEVTKKYYRPDMAAYIAGHAAARMIDGARTVERAGYTLAYAHVDALFHDGPEGLLNPSDWKTKGVGDFRGYSVGCYDFAGVSKVSGVAKGKLTPEYFDKVRRSSSLATSMGRRWFSAEDHRKDGISRNQSNPATDPGAVSVPHGVKLAIDGTLLYC